MAHRQPTPETLAFGAEAARLRDLAGLSRSQLAKKAAVTASYIGIVETGVTRCRYDFAERLDTALDTGTALADAWSDLLEGKGYPRYFVDFTKAESSAVILRIYEAFVIYGLLQTEAYARVLLVSDGAVSGRMKRQALLTRDDPPMFCVVMDESVLHRQVGDQAVMREQLEHLIEMSKRPNVTVHISPTAYYRGVNGSFAVATQPNGSEVAYLLDTTAGRISNESADIVHVAKAFLTLQ